MTDSYYGLRRYVIFSFNGTVLAGEIKEILEGTIIIFFKVHIGEHMISFFENVF